MTLIAKLNEDLALEFQSIVQYTQHVATIKGAEYKAIVEEIEGHLVQELEHAKILASQIDFLGGTPTVEVPEIPYAPDGEQALKTDLALEEEQLERYRKRVLQAIELGLPDVAEALRPLLQQTQDHVADLRHALNE